MKIARKRGFKSGILAVVLLGLALLAAVFGLRTAKTAYGADNTLADCSLDTVYDGTRYYQDEIEFTISRAWTLDVTFIWGGGDYEEEETASGVRTFFVNAGVYTLHAVNNDSPFDERDYTFTIAKAAARPFAVFNFNNTSAFYSGGQILFNAYTVDELEDLLSFGYEISDTYKNNADNAVTAFVINVGTYTQTLQAINAPNYLDTAIRTRTVNVTKANLTVVFSNDTQVNFDSVLDLSTISVVSMNALGQDANKTLTQLFGSDFRGFLTSDYSKGAPVTGTYHVTFLNTASLANYNLSSSGGLITVNKVAYPQGGIVFSNASLPYSGQVQTITASNIPNGVSVEYQNNTRTIVGTQTAAATFSCEPNYTPLTLTAQLTITKVDLRTDGITFENASFPYTGSPITLLAAINANLYPNEVSVEYLTSNSRTALGTQTVRARFSCEPNFNAIVLEADLTVTTAPLPLEWVSFTSKSFPYDGNAHSLAATYPSYVSVVYSSNNSLTERGTVTVTATFSCKPNYDDVTLNATLTVTVGDLDIAGIIFNGQSFTYDGQPHSLAATNLNGYSVSYQNNSRTNVGTQVVSATFSNGENYGTKTLNANLTVTARSVTLTFETQYDFNYEAAIAPVLLSAVDANDNGVTVPLTVADCTFTFYNAAASEPRPALNAIWQSGEYDMRVTLTNNNYALSSTAFIRIKVNPLTVAVTLGEIRYAYGTSGRVNDNSGAPKFEIASNFKRITVFNVKLPNNTTVDVSFGGERFDFKNKNTGVDILTTDVERPANFIFTLTGTNRVIIDPAELTVTWVVDGYEILSNSRTLSYSGTNRYYGITLKLFGFKFSDSASNFGRYEILINTSPSKKEIINVGSYPLTAVLLDTSNYVVNSNVNFTVNITKVSLSVKVNNLYLLQGEALSGITASLTGRVGLDENKALSTIIGRDLEALAVTTPAYSLSSPVGTYTLTLKADDLNAVLLNYTATVTAGTLTVGANPYPSNPYPPEGYPPVEYNGRAQQALWHLTGVSNAITVTYEYRLLGENNAYTVVSEIKNVGAYEIRATLNRAGYSPTTWVCRVYIIKAAPIVTLNAVRVVLYDGANYDSFLSGTAKIGSLTLSGGTYRFVTQPDASGTFSVVYTPADTANVLETTINCEVVCEKIELLLNLGFAPEDNITFDIDGTAKISGDVTATLKVPDGMNADDFSLFAYRDGIGNAVANIKLTRTEDVLIQIKWLGAIVFEHTLVVELIGGEYNKPVDESCLKGTNVRIGTNRQIFVKEGGGYLEIADEYKGKYRLFVNGIELDRFILNGEEEEVLIWIENLQGLKLFQRTYAVSVEVKPPEVIKPPYKKYAIISLACLGGAGGLFGGIAIFRKTKGARAKHKRWSKTPD